TDRGSCRYDCSKDNPETYYWNAALAAALYLADERGFGSYKDLAEKVYGHLLANQKPAGNFDFSNKNYYFLADHRSYPRQLAMILDCLLMRVNGTDGKEGH